jgi:hypothetical protein
MAEATRLASARANLGTAIHRAWDAAVYMGGGTSPLRGATRLAEGDLTVEAGFGPDGPRIGEVHTALVGQTLTVRADGVIAPAAGAWVTVGRMGAAVSSRAVSPPDLALQAPWQTPHLWDTFEPRSWVIVPTNTSDAITVVLDRPGQWMIGMGVAYEEWMLDDEISPVGHPEYSAYARYRPVWQVFEVIEEEPTDS